MPAFFIISGFCSNFKKDVSTFTKTLLKGLILPLFTLSLIADITYAIGITHQNLSTTILKTLSNGGTLWFIQALIIAKLICFIIQKQTCSIIQMLLVTFTFLVIGVTLNQFKIGSNPFNYQHGLVASFFVALGLYFKENTITYEKVLKFSIIFYPFIGVITFWYSPNITASLSVSLKNIPLFLVLSTLGTFFLIALCKKIKNCRILEFWGQNSLVVYGLHFTPYIYLFKTLYSWIYPTNAISFINFLFLLFFSEYLLCYMLMCVFQCKPFNWLIGKFES